MSTDGKFYVYARFQRYDVDGTAIPQRRNEPLVVTGLWIKWGQGGYRYGILDFSDGTRSGWFRMDPASPSFLAKTAENYRKFAWAVGEAS